MALTDAKRRANDKYIRENYERLPVSYSKTFCQLVRAAAEASGESLAGFVRKAIEDRIRRQATTLDGDVPPAIQAYIQSTKAGE